MCRGPAPKVFNVEPGLVEALLERLPLASSLVLVHQICAPLIPRFSSPRRARSNLYVHASFQLRTKHARPFGPQLQVKFWEILSTFGYQCWKLTPRMTPCVPWDNLSKGHSWALIFPPDQASDGRPPAPVRQQVVSLGVGRIWQLLVAINTHKMAQRTSSCVLLDNLRRAICGP